MKRRPSVLIVTRNAQGEATAVLIGKLRLRPQQGRRTLQFSSVFFDKQPVVAAPAAPATRPPPRAAACANAVTEAEAEADADADVEYKTVDDSDDSTATLNAEAMKKAATEVETEAETEAMKKAETEAATGRGEDEDGNEGENEGKDGSQCLGASAVRSTWTVVDAAAHGLSHACMGGMGLPRALRARLLHPSTRRSLTSTRALYVVTDAAVPQTPPSLQFRSQTVPQTASQSTLAPSQSFSSFVRVYNALARSLRASLFRHSPQHALWELLPPDAFAFEELVWFSAAQAQAAWSGAPGRHRVWHGLCADAREDVRTALATVCVPDPVTVCVPAPAPFVGLFVGPDHAPDRAPAPLDGADADVLLSPARVHGKRRRTLDRTTAAKKDPRKREQP